MPSPVRLLAASAALAVLLAGPHAARAGELAPRPGSLALSGGDGSAGPAAGSVLTAEWRVPAGDDADEMELVLSLDGGRTWPVRITGDIPPSQASVAFRVPALPSREARVALRAGRKGEADSEAIVAESASFAIRPGSAGSLETLRRVRDEWRTTEAMEGESADGPGSPAVSGIPALSGGIRSDAEAVARDDGACVSSERPAWRVSAPSDQGLPCRSKPPAPPPLLISRRE